MPGKPYAFRLVVADHRGRESTIVRVALDEKQARRKALMRRTTERVVSAVGMTRSEYDAWAAVNCRSRPQRLPS